VNELLNLFFVSCHAHRTLSGRNQLETSREGLGIPRISNRSTSIWQGGGGWKGQKGPPISRQQCHWNGHRWWCPLSLSTRPIQSAQSASTRTVSILTLWYRLLLIVCKIQHLRNNFGFFEVQIGSVSFIFLSNWRRGRYLVWFWQLACWNWVSQAGGANFWNDRLAIVVRKRGADSILGRMRMKRRDWRGAK